MGEEGFVGSDLFVGACFGGCFSGAVLGWPVRGWSCACRGVVRAWLVWSAGVVVVVLGTWVSLLACDQGVCVMMRVF